MDDFGTHPNWTHFQERWLDYAQRVKAQWPEIAFSDILAMQGSRGQLCVRVAETYGLTVAEADRAVAIWQHAQLEHGRSDEPAAPTPVA
jgi:hypothetical protein